MTDVEIRPYEESDLEACRSLWAELTQRHRDIYRDQTIGGTEPGLYFDKHLERGGEQNLWVAVSDENVVGMVGLMLEGDPEVEPLVVNSEFRNRGIGSKMLKHAIEKARESKVRYLSIRPVARNQEAISLFHKTGFDLLGHIEMFMDLHSEPRTVWKTGLDLLGQSFRY